MKQEKRVKQSIYQLRRIAAIDGNLLTGYERRLIARVDKKYDHKVMTKTRKILRAEKQEYFNLINSIDEFDESTEINFPEVIEVEAEKTCVDFCQEFLKEKYKAPNKVEDRTELLTDLKEFHKEFYHMQLNRELPRKQYKRFQYLVQNWGVTRDELEQA